MKEMTNDILKSMIYSLVGILEISGEEIIKWLADEYGYSKEEIRENLPELISEEEYDDIDDFDLSLADLDIDDLLNE